MKKILFAVLAMGIMTGCGSSSSTSQEPAKTIEDFATIGAIDCRNINKFGGEVTMKARLQYGNEINLDSFTYEYSIDGKTLDFDIPTVTFSRDSTVLQVDGKFYIYPNDTNSGVTHEFSLTYLDGFAKKLFSGGCKQGVYIRVVDTNITTRIP